MTSERVAQAYSSLAGRYIELLGSVDSRHPNDLRLIDGHLGRLAGPVLDLGSGPGHLSGFLSLMDSEVTGVHLVPELIAHARQSHPAARFYVGSLAELARPDASVAGVLPGSPSST